MADILVEESLKRSLGLPNMELPIFILQFLNDMKSKGRKASTYIRYGYYLNDFKKWIIDYKKIADITLEEWSQLNEEDYSAYYHYLIEEKKYSIVSMKRIESVLNSLKLYIVNTLHKESTSPIIKQDVIEKAKPQSDNRDFVSEADFKKLIRVMKSKEGLTDNQLISRDRLINRNVAIVTLFYKYGLTLNELINIKMTDLDFGVAKIIRIPDKKGSSRIVELDMEDKKLILAYLDDCKDRRPLYHVAHHHLFAAFHYHTDQYFWVYNEDTIPHGNPRPLSCLAVQKMIKQEVRRAGLDNKGISAQSMRNSAILRYYNEHTEQETMEYFGLKTPITLRKYKTYLKTS